MNEWIQQQISNVNQSKQEFFLQVLLIATKPSNTCNLNKEKKVEREEQTTTNNTPDQIKISHANQQWPPNSYPRLHKRLLPEKICSL
jgi:hypothetical protein